MTRTTSTVRPALPVLVVATVVSLVSIHATSVTAATRPSEVPPPTTVDPTCADAQEPISSLDVDIGGRQRTALVHVPNGVAPIVPVPVVLSFHGAGDYTMELDEWDGFKPLADREGFVVVHPQGSAVEMVPGLPVDPGWDILGLHVDEAAFVDALLDELGTHVCIDTARVFAVGYSLGGALSLSLACTLGERLVAIATVAALPLYQCPNPQPMPTMMFHGLDDLFVPYLGDDAIELPSIEEAAATIATRNGCADTPYTSASVTSGVDQLTWSECAAPTVLYRITDHGHAWPGHTPAFTRDEVAVVLETSGVVPPGLSPAEAADNMFMSTPAIDATTVMWEFFASQR